VFDTPSVHAALLELRDAAQAFQDFAERTRAAHEAMRLWAAHEAMAVAARQQCHSNAIITTPITASAGSAGASGGHWWRQETDASVVDYLHRTFTEHKFNAAVPSAFGQFSSIAAPPPQLAGTVRFYVSDKLVVKVYCIGAAGIFPDQGTKECKRAADACMDACATSLVCDKRGWYCNTFGLILGGMAHVCIGRHRLREWVATPKVVGQFVHNLAIDTRVVHLDCHCNELEP
jgi:hypothetical protein